MTWQNFIKKIMTDLGCGRRIATHLRDEFAEHFGRKEAIQELKSVRYTDNGKVEFRFLVNDKIKQITI